jgi:hypothetical protein
MQIIGKEEIRISRCKYKKIFLQNINGVIKIQVRVGVREFPSDGSGPKDFNRLGPDPKNVGSDGL